MLDSILIKLFWKHYTSLRLESIDIVEGFFTCRGIGIVGCALESIDIVEGFFTGWYENE